jgi:hypothetical protein
MNRNATTRTVNTQIVQNALVVNLDPLSGRQSERFILISESPSVERVYLDGMEYDLEAYLMAQHSLRTRHLTLN